MAEVGWKREFERTRAAERVGELQREPAAHALALHEVVPERRELGGGEDVEAGGVGHHLKRYAPTHHPWCGTFH